jgi:hypothetical protein
MTEPRITVAPAALTGTADGIAPSEGFVAFPSRRGGALCALARRESNAFRAL